MNELLDRYRTLWEPSWSTALYVLDILLVAYLIFRVLKLIRGRRAGRIVAGIIAFVLVLVLSDLAGLRTLHWVLEKAAILLPVALVILLLPELRQAIEGFSRFGIIPSALAGPGASTKAAVIEEIVSAATDMSEERIGALIVIERQTRLTDVISNGVAVNADVSALLLGSIFFGTNPLHDGAVIVRGDQIVAAGCRLPMSENPNLPTHMHMRHQAGTGMSEQSDAVVIIISEERGQISVAIEGQIRKVESRDKLRETLNEELRGFGGERKRAVKRLRTIKARREKKEKGKPGG